MTQDIIYGTLWWCGLAFVAVWAVCLIGATWWYVRRRRDAQADIQWEDGE
jgi:hypothetical protein